MNSGSRRSAIGARQRRDAVRQVQELWKPKELERGNRQKNCAANQFEKDQIPELLAKQSSVKWKQSF